MGAFCLGSSTFLLSLEQSTKRYTTFPLCHANRPSARDNLLTLSLRLVMRPEHPITGCLRSGASLIGRRGGVAREIEPPQDMPLGIRSRRKAAQLAATNEHNAAAVHYAIIPNLTAEAARTRDRLRIGRERSFNYGGIRAAAAGIDDCPRARRWDSRQSPLWLHNGWPTRDSPF